MGEHNHDFYTLDTAIIGSVIILSAAVLLLISSPIWIALYYYDGLKNAGI